MSYHRLLLIQTLAPTHNGQSDQPHRLLRDTETSLPLIRSTTLLGALRKQLRDARYAQYQTAENWKAAAQNDPEQLALFGTPDAPAGLQSTPARLLLLPVRALQGVFSWVISPQILKALASHYPEQPLPKIPQLASSETICSAEHPSLMAETQLVFEELAFKRKEDSTELLNWLRDTLHLPERVLNRLAIISDHLLLHFARHALVSQVYHAQTPSGLRQHLECLPAQTWFYSILSHSSPWDSSQWPNQAWLGSHRSTGQGLCHLTLLPEQSLSLGNSEAAPQKTDTSHEDTTFSEQEAA